MPAVGLGSEGSAVAAQRKAKRRSRSGGGRSDHGSPDFPIHCSSDHRFSSGDGGGDFASGSLYSSAAGSFTDGGDRNDLGMWWGFRRVDIVVFAWQFSSVSWDENNLWRYVVTPVVAFLRIQILKPGFPLSLFTFHYLIIHPKVRTVLLIVVPSTSTAGVVSSPLAYSLMADARSLKHFSCLAATAEDFVQRGLEDDEGRKEEKVEEVSSLDPSKHCFSHPPKECQGQQCRSEEAVLTSRKLQRRRPVSLDFNSQIADASFISPRFFVGVVATEVKKSCANSSQRRSSMLPSPRTPSYRHGVRAAAYQKGWSSERVPLPAHSCRRRGNSGLILPFVNGRTLPSKWEDAERWIFSPVPIEGAGKSPLPLSHHRCPKSKSEPLGPQAKVGLGYTYSASPLVPCCDNSRVGNITANSPFLAGVLIPERGFCVNSGRGRGGSASVCSGGIGVVGVGGHAMGGKTHSTVGDSYIFRSASIHGWSDNLIESSSSVPSSRDEKSDGMKEAASTISVATLRKDVATQMSPDGSTSVSHDGPSSPSPASAPAIVALEGHFTKLEVRDVQVDDRVLVTRWSRKHIARGSDRQSTSIIEWKKTIEANNTSWEVTDTAKSISKFKREEAKISAWENLQKAKAEADIKKLEMKLERKRSSSMERILNKLRSAQKKAQEMRSAMTASQANQVAKPMKKVSPLCKNGQISSLSGCFTCHAF
ncbi:hypothetical protein ZIOFF_046357 [Zingiber officinale]|uniref:Remorin C-terminal domain-containing protein n=1 Tax=Zingiber officinale TaxID=94328 RepID=A0A8J5KSF5_ZINOF|nr:hypothetical protein ZIOFF_046357 [Zingiber officinale]